MQTTNMQPGSRILLVLAFTCLLYSFVRSVIRYFQVRKFKHIHGCKPARRVPQPERIIGLSTYLTLRSDRQRRISLQETARRAYRLGYTTTAVVLGVEFLSTCDPENIKALLATKFGDFGIGPRIHVLGPLLGRGIFTLDDVPWQHSRVSP